MIVLDTHAWLWWAGEISNLGRAAARAIRDSRVIGVSAMSCLEVSMLVAKGRVSLDTGPLEWMEAALSLPRVRLLPLTPAVAVKAHGLGAHFHGDPGDRVIVATAILESAKLVTKDTAIRAFGGVDVVW